MYLIPFELFRALPPLMGWKPLHKIITGIESALGYLYSQNNHFY